MGFACKAALALLAVTSVSDFAAAADFAGGGTGPIPDANASGVNVTFNVSGIVNPVSRLRLRLGLTHTFVGDLKATLISPNGTAQLVVFGRPGTSVGGSNSDFNGTYTFEDAGGDLWAAAHDAAGTIVAATHYRTSTADAAGTRRGGCATSLAGAFNGLSGSNVNGTWTLNVADLIPGDTGSVTSALLTVLDDGMFNDSFDSVRGSCKLALFDFTGTGMSSYAVVRNTGGGSGGTTTWFIQSNNATASGPQQNFVLGVSSDFFEAGDFDGDGIADAAVWRPGPAGTAQFIVRRSSRPNDAPLTFVMGKTGDDPSHIGDYDGDGIDDFVLYRAGANAGDASHTLIHLSRSGTDRDLVTGENGAFPAGGVDYTGDGRADMAIQSNAGGGVAAYRIYDGTTGAMVNTFNFGTPTDVVVIGNHSGNALYDINVVKPNAGNLVWTTYDLGTSTGQPSMNVGLSATDFVLSGDYDGDGLDDYAVWRPSATPGMSQFIINGTAGTPINVNFGQNGDYPIANSRRH